MMGVLFSKRWTSTLVKELGDAISSRRVEGSSCSVGFYVTDNKAYFVKISHMHAEEGEGVTQMPRSANGHFLLTALQAGPPFSWV